MSPPYVRSCPSFNGIVGIKPTVGLVGRSGIVSISHSQDTAGPMARTVSDAAALLSAIAGADADDTTTQAAAPHAERDYTRFLDGNGLRGARLGVVRKLAGFNTHVDRLFAEALAAMKGSGAELIDPVEIPSIGTVDEPEFQVLLFEFKANLNRYLAWLGAQSPVHTLKDVIAFNEKNEARELRYFGQESMERAEAKGPLSDPEYQKNLAECRRMSRTEGIDAVMEKLRLDALIAPTDGLTWPTDLANGGHFTGSSSTLPAVAGYPHITVPMGFAFGLPVGVSFFRRAWSEAQLLKLSYAFERAMTHPKPPQFRARAE